jgi:type VI secretion system secreted protein VgrG
VAQREARIKVEAKAGDFRLRSLSGREELSRPFRYDLVLHSGNLDVRLEALLGTGITVELDAHNQSLRYFHGLVADASFIGTEGPMACYGVQLVPWLWFLDRKQDCRIFQNKTVPDIVREVLEKHDKIADFDVRLTESYEEREYCVQYRESDLNFVSRLLEEEGIYYFFEHKEGSHKAILADHPGKHDPAPHYDKVPYYPPDQQRHRERDHLSSWQVSARVRPGRATLKAFDFENPTQDLTSTEAAPMKHALADHEFYDYPGPYVKLEHNDTLARVRLEELQSDHRRAAGAGDAAGLACGRRFKLQGYPREDQNTDYLLVAVESSIVVEPERSGGGSGGAPYRCTIEVHDIKQPFRPARLTPRPFVQGPQTAMVTGPAGEEIYTDKYGRVKLQFPWDREGKSDENSSCWVRVSQNWAGSGFGAMHIPRIGQECIVDFLEGDPDRPIITGRVYNGLAMPPYGLPGSATQSGLKSNSSKGGGGSNELRFEDKKGSEEVYFHAQKDFNAVVENDETQHVKNNRTGTVDVDETLTVHGNRARTVDGNETVTIGGNETYKTGGNRIYDLAGNETLSVGGNQDESITGNLSLSVTGNQEHAVTGNSLLTVTMNREVSATMNYKVEALAVEITGKTAISLTVGGSFVKIDPSGVTIFGPMVKLN